MFYLASDSSGVIASKKYAAVTGNQPIPLAVRSNILRFAGSNPADGMVVPSLV